MILKNLQRELERIYALEAGPSIDQFLISSEELKTYLSTGDEATPQVLFREEKGEVFLAVHVGDRELARLEKGGVETCELSDFCTVVEELSHFRFLSWKANHDQEVTLLDVELQGEIDKFLLASRYFDQEADLFARLFDRVVFGGWDDRSVRSRYLEANRLGGKFCRALGNLFEGEAAQRQEALARLRAFYRLASPTRLAQTDRL